MAEPATSVGAPYSTALLRDVAPMRSGRVNSVAPTMVTLTLCPPLY